MNDWHQRMTEDLQLRGLSERTQTAYLRAVRKLAEHADGAPEKLEERQVREYLLFLKNVREFAPGSLRIALNGIKFFYRYTEPRDWTTLLNVRIAQQKTLPDVLSVDETRQLASVNTSHNRAYLWTVYSCGLRLNEALHLQVSDIDSQRMMIHVHRGKGAEDRFVMLPEGTLRMLRGYWLTVGDGASAVKYLAPYVFRVAVSDRRIVASDDEQVTFSYCRTGSARRRRMTVSGDEFLRRLLAHVLPRGFQKVRHYGLLSPNSRTRFESLQWLVAAAVGMLFLLACSETTTCEERGAVRCAECGQRMLLILIVAPAAACPPSPARGPP